MNWPRTACRISSKAIPSSPAASSRSGGWSTGTRRSSDHVQAVALARKAAAGKDISLAGGAKVCQQYLVDDLKGLELVRTIAAHNVTHLKFRSARVTLLCRCFSTAASYTHLRAHETPAH